MPKVATQWITNTVIGTVDTFDSTAVYDETGNYDGMASGQSTITVKKPSIWSSSSKDSTIWITNQLHLAGLREYDSHTLYDTKVKYDGNTVSKITTKLPTTWSAT